MGFDGAANWLVEDVRGGIMFGDGRKVLWSGVGFAEEEGTAMVERCFWDLLYINMGGSGRTDAQTLLRSSKCWPVGTGRLSDCL